MKKRISKKMLSAFLAVLMIVTSIPLVSFADAEAEVVDSAVQAVTDAMGLFEAKLQSPGAYTNVDVAYAKYVECQKAIDAYVYGGESDALGNLATEMTNYVNGNAALSIPGIQPFTPFTAESKTGTWPANGYTGTISEVIYQNLAYCGSADTDYVSVTAGDRKAYMKIRFTPAVMMYDGVTAPLMPVMAVIGANKGSSWANRFFYSITLTDNFSNSLQLVDNWKGKYKSGTNWDYTYQRYDSSAGNYRLGISSTSSSYNAQVVKKKTIGADEWPEGDTNVIRFDGTKSDGTAVFPEGVLYKAVTPTFTGYAGSTSTFTNNDANGVLVGASSKTIGIINYKAVMDAMTKNGDKMKSIEPSEYSEGGLTTYIQAMENATKWNPYNFFTSSSATSIDDDVILCTNAMSGIIDAMDDASTTQTNNVNYAKLRAAMSESVRGIYADTNYDENNEMRYTQSTWENFENAYEAAEAVMALCNDSDHGYDATNCGTLATNLNRYAGELTPNVATVDTTALEASINTFYTYNNIFTAGSYSNAETVINSAKETVWGSVADYGKKDRALVDNANNQLIYNEALTSVNNAIEGLRLDMDYVVVTSEGRYSLNTALALRDNVISHYDDYGNWEDFSTAVSNANAYASRAAGTKFTNFDTQLQEYIDQIVTLVQAYEGLTYSFVKIPNGTVASTGPLTQMTTLTSSDQGQQDITFSYSTSGVVLKTTHAGATVPYGIARVVFGTTIKDRENNMLDSISINATQPMINSNGGKQHITDLKTFNSTPNAIDGTTYAGCLSYNNFSLSNIKLIDRTYNNVAGQYFTYADGTKETNSATAYSYDATAILGTTEGAAANPGKGGFFVRSNDASLATVTLEGNFNYTFQSTTPQTLTRDTIPASISYQLSGTKFGAVTIYNCTNKSNCVGYDWFTSEITGETINTICTVVDISNLTDLVALCNQELADGANKYTTESWTYFGNKLKAAQADMNYQTLSAAQIIAQTKIRYQELWDAKKDLIPKPVTSTFNYKDENGEDTSTVIDTSYGESIDMTAVNAITPPTYSDSAYTYTFTGWSPEVYTGAMTVEKVYTAEYSAVRNQINVTFNYKDENGEDTSTVIKVDYGDYVNMSDVNAIAPPTYMDDDYIYTFTGWSPEPGSEPVMSAHTHTAQYSTEERVADFTAFDAALAAVNAKLVNGALSVEALNTAKATIEAFSPDYIHYTSAEKAATKVSAQATITAQAEALAQIATDLQADADAVALMDYTAYDAVEVTGRAKYAVDDMYSGDNISLPARTQTVAILDKSVTAQIYKDQAVVNTMIENALNNRAIRTYTIYINDEPMYTADYGTQVVIDSENAIYRNAASGDVDTSSLDDVAWYYCYSAPSTSNSKTASKYMATSPVFEFIVKGDTYLTTQKVESQESNCYTVTFKAVVAGVARTFDVVYTTDGSVTIPDAPAYAYYHFNGRYIDAETKAQVTAGSTISVSSNMTVAAFYEGDASDLYTIDFYDTELSFEDGPEGRTSTNTYEYNKLVTLTSSNDPYLWAKAVYDDDEGCIRFYALAYGISTYSFYACQSVTEIDDLNWSGIVAITQQEYEVIVSDQDGTYLLYDTNGDVVHAAKTDMGALILDPKPSTSVLNNVIRKYKGEDELSKELTKISLVGSFAVPSGYEVIEAGFLFTKNIDLGRENLKLENVGTENIARMKAARYTVGNQYVVNVMAPTSTVSFDYIGYIIVRDTSKSENEDGYITTYYSNVGGERNFDPSL